MKPPQTYVYKCVWDDGGAPCVDFGLFSLTICKPAIRRKAEPGDIIFAFGGNNEETPNRLVYIAKVTQRHDSGEYFKLKKYRGRQDCIYNVKNNGRIVHRPDKCLHSQEGNWIKDVGEHPDYANAVALVSDDFRYFGREGTDDWKRSCPFLAKEVERLDQGHRVRWGAVQLRELTKLKQAIWKKHPRKKVLGTPLHGLSLSTASCSTPRIKLFKMNRRGDA